MATKPKLIPVAEIRKAPRGRRASYNTDLLEILSAVKPGFAAVLDDVFGKVEKDKRNAVSQTVRTHWKRVHDTSPSLNFSEDGTLQVSHRETSEE